MTPLPASLGGTGLRAWRLERTKHFATWQSAQGSFLVGGRWSTAGRRVLYTSLDPATCILEVAVHKGLDTLDRVPHELLEINVDPAAVRVVQPADIPNPNWLRPGLPSRNQQAFGNGLLDAHPVVVLPSVVSTRSWNLLIDVGLAAGAHVLVGSERFALDTRLAPASTPPA